MSEVATQSGVLERLGVEVSRTSLSLPINLAYEDFEEVCAFVGGIHDSSRWWLADAFIQGEKLFGDTVYQAAELMRLSPHRIQNIISVGRSVPPSRRRERVDFSHHEEVAGLEPNDQRHWLKVADEERLTKAELRATETMFWMV